MAATQQYVGGKAVIFGTSATSGTPISFTIKTPGSGSTSLTGYVYPIITGVNVSHQAETDMIKNESGDVVAVITHGEYLEATFECVPSGGTLADARTSATLPALGSTVIITGADVIPIGSFADGINVTDGDSTTIGKRWIYLGGGTVRTSSDGHATMSLPLKRFPGVTGGTAIVD